MECTDDELINPTYKRILAVATGLSANSKYTLEQIHLLSGIDPWFLCKIQKIVRMVEELKDTTVKIGEQRKALLLQAKRLGFSDAGIAHFIGSTELVVRGEREKYHIHPDIKQIDTVAAEFPCRTNYLYFTYATSSPTKKKQPKLTSSPSCSRSTIPTTSVIVLGSGVYQIGSSVEFDCCAVSCIRELRSMGKKVIIINCNPETVSTDYDEADSLYFCEISLENVLNVQYAEKSQGVIVSVGGQVPNNIAMQLQLQGLFATFEIFFVNIFD